MRGQSYIKNNSHQNNIRGGETKVMKKVLNTLLVLALIFTMAAPAFAADLTTQQKFDELKAAGVISGDANGNMLAVDSEMSRQMLAKIAVQLQGLAPTPGVEIAAFADDYKTGVWGFEQGWIQAAYTAGLMQGKGEAGFDATGTVTTGELLTVIVRSMGLEGLVDTSKTWPAGHMDVAVAQGLTVAGADAKANANYGDLVVQSYNSYQYNNPTPANLEVSGVSGVNGRTVQITFNKAVDATTVVSGANLLLNTTFTAIGTAPAITSAAAAASLSDDGKVLTVTPAVGEFVNGSYAVTVTNAVTDVDGNAADAYSAVISLTDTVRPTVQSVTYPVNGSVTVTFSEPIDTATTAFAGVVRDNNGAVIATPAITPAADEKSFTMNITGFTADVNYTLTMVGLKDYPGNLINPNPTTLTIVNSVVDSVAPTVTGITLQSTTQFSITFSEALSAAPTVTLGGTDVTTTLPAGTVTVDANDATKYNVVLGAATSGIVTVGVNAGYTDLSTNAGLAWSQLVQLVADTTDPTYVSHEIVTILGVQYLVVKYSENITAVDNAIAGTYVDVNSITNPAAIAGGASNTTLYDPDGDGVSDSIKINLTGQLAGTYTLTIGAGQALDSSANASVAASTTFALGTLGDTTLPTSTVTSVQAVTDKVIITYSEAMNPASALNVNNYLVEGVPVFDSAIFAGAANIVELTLKPNAISVTGLRNLTIQNAADAAGNVMLSSTTQQTFKENVKPTITTAVLATDLTIDVTFSEAVANAADGTADFEVYVNGVNNVVTGVALKAGNTYTITFTTAVANLTDVVTVKVLTTNNITDTTVPANVLGTSGTITVTH